MLSILKNLITKYGIYQCTLQQSSVLKLNLSQLQTDFISKLVAKIKATGPITIFEYMQEVLNTPQYGYYSSRANIGSKGDFVTSPEISQVFGELLGVWLVSEWMRQGRHKDAQLVELGPGNGTLAEDIIRVLSQLKVQNEFACINLIETSPYLTKLQFERLCCKAHTCKPDLCVQSGVTESGLPVFWYTSVTDIPAAPSYFVANEFFDALPIHQFIRTDNNKWREILIDREGEENKLRFIISSYKTKSLAAFSNFFLRSTADKIEVNPISMVITEQICKNLKDSGVGSCIVVDYGDIESRNFTFRGFKDHKEWNVLLDPATADLTADLNFGSLTSIASKYASVYGPVNQNIFLHRMGIRERILSLMKSSSREQSHSHARSYEFLTSSDYMGERFKVLAVTSDYDGVPFGFES